jgi:hypothetical protein
MRAGVGYSRGQTDAALANGGTKRAAERYGKPSANVAVEQWHHTASLSIWTQTVNHRIVHARRTHMFVVRKKAFF